MSEELISEGVIKERIDNLTKLINSQFETNSIEHEKITKQVMMTNGSVRRLQLAGAYTKGAIAVLTLLVVPILLVLIKEYLVN